MNLFENESASLLFSHRGLEVQGSFKLNIKVTKHLYLNKMGNVLHLPYFGIMMLE